MGKVLPKKCDCTQVAMPPQAVQLEDRHVFPVQSQQKLYKEVYKNVQVNYKTISLPIVLSKIGWAIWN
jgi:hypothetical protein